MKNTLKQTAAAHGYGNELCDFLDRLVNNIQLTGIGEYTVANAIEQELPEYSIVKIALANIGRVLGEDSGTGAPNLAELEKAGEAEFVKHCTPSGKFRYGDYKLTPPAAYKPCGGLFG